MGRDCCRADDDPRRATVYTSHYRIPVYVGGGETWQGSPFIGWMETSHGSTRVAYFVRVALRGGARLAIEC